jgi:hypothetical protein
MKVINNKWDTNNSKKANYIEIYHMYTSLKIKIKMTKFSILKKIRCLAQIQILKE